MSRITPLAVANNTTGKKAAELVNNFGYITC
jgi:hypothetical protein